ncbi:hypothetical protein [Bradyrhizobium liaoningense]|uniref:hypothetical protein n=1 Tax=Bradyrhizobium liaoningense TaxID=43992 RepID=UPI0004B303FA|nr:hypothetical protein [Bradyrhizobium liaoningense]
MSVVLSGPAAPIVVKKPDARVSIELSEHISGEELAVKTIGGRRARAEGSGDSKDTGEGERVGIVFWPPPVLNLPLLKTQPPFNEIEVPQSTALGLLTEEDLDPFGRFVSVWGIDPIKREPLEPIDRHRFLSWNDLKLPDLVSWEMMDEIR